MCDHKWECSDIPGLYFCECGGTRYFDRENQSYYIEEPIGKECAMYECYYAVFKNSSYCKSHQRLKVVV